MASRQGYCAVPGLTAVQKAALDYSMPLFFALGVILLAPLRRSVLALVRRAMYLLSFRRVRRRNPRRKAGGGGGGAVDDGRGVVRNDMNAGENRYDDEDRGDSDSGGEGEDDGDDGDDEDKDADEDEDGVYGGGDGVGEGDSRGGHDAIGGGVMSGAKSGRVGGRSRSWRAKHFKISPADLTAGEPTYVSLACMIDADVTPHS